jgi:hypothetical protein
MTAFPSAPAVVRHHWNQPDLPACHQRPLFEAETAPVVRFHSGSSAYWDFRGYMLAGAAIGITATEMPKNDGGRMVCAIAEHTRRGGLLFVDSGAFGAFVARRALDFEAEVFPAFDSILAAGAQATQLRLVMPDVVGDPEASLRLQRRHAARIRAWMDAGAQCIFPLHSPDAGRFLRAVHHIADGRSVTIGIPSNLEAWSLRELLRFCERHAPQRIHLLGLGQADKVQAIAEAVANVSPRTAISCDSCSLIAHVGTGRRLTDRCRSRLHDALGWVMTDTSADVSFPVLSTYVTHALHTANFLDEAAVALIAERFGVELQAALAAARTVGLLEVLGPLDPDEEWLEGELSEFIRLQIYGPELERVLRGPIRAWEVARLAGHAAE